MKLLLKTTRTQTVRFVSVIDPKVDVATIIKRRAYLSKLALLTINGGREIAIGSAARLLFSQMIAAEQEQALIAAEVTYYR